MCLPFHVKEKFIFIFIQLNTHWNLSKMIKAVELDRQIFYTHCIMRRNNISVCFIKGFYGKTSTSKRNHIENVGVYRSIILKYILNKLDGTGWLASSGSEYRKKEGLCELGNEPSVFIKRTEFLNLEVNISSMHLVI